MKKNSFKRFLAVTLAAATALTFAPVSTLGLTGVVEAQAADNDGDNVVNITATAGSSSATTLTGDKAETVDASNGDKTVNIVVSGLTASKGLVKVTDLGGRTIKNGGTAVTKGAVQTADNNGKVTLAVTIPKSTKTTATTYTIKLTADHDDATTATSTDSDEYTVTIKDTAAAAAEAAKKATKITFNDGTTDTTKVEYGSTAIGQAQTNVKVKFENGSSAENLQVTSSDLSVATVSADATTGTNADRTLTITPKKAGSAKITVTTDGGKTASLDVVVLGAMRETSAKVDTTAVDVPSNASAKAVANVVETGEYMSVKTNGNYPEVPTFTVTPVSDKDAAGDITVTTLNATDATVSADSKTATYPIKVTNNSGMVGHQYKIKATVAGVTVSPDTLTVTIVNPADSNCTYGGVLTDILAYKDASYDLAEHAAVSYQPADTSASKVNLTGSELTWTLVDGTTINKFAVGDQRADLKRLNIPATDGTIAQGSTGSLKVTVADADKFVTDVDGAILVAEATINGTRTVVYKSSPVTVTKISTKNVAVISKTITASVSDESRVADATKLPVLDEQIANPTQDNKYLKAKEVSFTDASEKETRTNYDLTVVKASGDDNPFKGSYLTLKNSKLSIGTYYETAYIPFKVNGDASDTTYIQKVDIVVSVNAGVHFRIKDGASILTSNFANDTIATDPTVYLNLVDAKTWNIKDHLEADVADISKVNFSYRSDSANVDVDSNGVLTAKSVGNAIIYVKATYNHIPTAEKELHVRVNKNGFDTITVTGKDGDQARVLGARDYNNNSVNVVTTEQNLVTKQIPYVQIEITGNETSNVTETPVVASKNNAKLTYAFVKDYTSKGLNIDPATGKITIDYTKCTDGNSNTPATAMGVYAVKVVSAETNSSAATTSYYYVVVDYPDQTISGLQDNYTVGACANLTDTHVNAVEMNAESKGTAKSFVTVDKTTDDFNGVKYYADDNVNAFDNIGYSYTNASGTVVSAVFASAGIIEKAKVAGQVEHVVAYNDTSCANKAGYTAKLITVKSAAAVDNYVTKIVNKTTGETLYDSTVNSTDTAKELKIDKATTLQVSLAHPVASVASGSAVTLKIKTVATDGSSIINQTPYVTAVKNSKDVDVALYPNSKGTTVIQIGPGGHLTATDRTDIHQKFVKVAVTYTGENAATATKPSKVTGLKVSNKKGAKVTVKYNKVTTAPTIKYYVQKKIGKKVSGKSVGSTKTTLSVAKGKTVKVRVKAYYYDKNGQKHVGAYSAWKTLKTDKK